jgi:Cu/Ag efflux pump CusA
MKSGVRARPAASMSPANAGGRDLGSVAREIEQRVRSLFFDRGYRPEFFGEDAALQESSRLLLASVAVLGILVLLHVEFWSWRLTWLVFLTRPFALIGGLLAVFLTGRVLSLGSLVGFVTVFGIAARNGIMLLSHYKHLHSIEGEPFGPELIIRGAEERLHRSS